MRVRQQEMGSVAPRHTNEGYRHETRGIDLRCNFVVIGIRKNAPPAERADHGTLIWSPSVADDVTETAKIIIVVLSAFYLFYSIYSIYSILLFRVSIVDSLGFK